MKKYFMDMPHTHSCVAGLYFCGGNIIEDNDVKGISHLLEHMFFRRCDSVKMRELYRELNEMGVTLHGITKEYLIGFYAQASPDNINRVINVLLRILNVFYWESQEIELEKQVVVRQINEKAESYFEMKEKEKYYRDTPFSSSIMGRGQDVERLCTDTVNRYKDMVFCCENAIFVLTGNFSEEYKEEINARIDEITEKDDRTTDRLKIHTNAIPRNFAGRTERDDLLLDCRNCICDICISFDIPATYNPFAVEILADILAKGDGSKLSWELKDSLGLVGDIWGEIERFSNFSRLKIEYAVANDNLFRSLESVVNIIKDLKENVSHDDIMEVIGFYTFLPYLEDDPLAYNYHIAKTVLGYGSLVYSVPDMVREYKKITEKELKILAGKIFVPENMCFSICGDGQKIKKSQLKRELKKLKEIL